jgi:tRNA-specific 2-thiouridylase
MTDTVELTNLTWVDRCVTGPVLAQSSAHGAAVTAEYDGEASLHFAEPHRRIAPGQSVVLYRDDEVLGGGMAA